MNVDLFHLYDTILDAQGIQFLLLSEPYDQIQKADYGFRDKVYENFDYQLFLQNIIKQAAQTSVLFFRDDLQLDYCFFELPGLLQTEYGSKYALIGPVLFRYMSNADLEHVIQQHQFPLTLSRDLLEFYNRIPALPTHDFWISLLTPLLKPILGTGNDYPFVNLSETMRYETSQQNALMPAASSGPSFDAIADRYKTSQDFTNAVTMGKADEAIEKYHKFRQFNFSERTPDLLRNSKNMFIVLNTQLRIAVADAQVHPYYIDELSREMAIKIEYSNSIAQLENLSITMIRKYALLAHNYSTKDYSPLIKKAIEQIRFYYSEPLSLESIADHCAVSPGYLSALFHKETGSTVTEYIQNTRMEHAILLLNSSQDSIMKIASLCGFPDANYFTRIFKRKKGITPKEYRKRILEL